MVDETTLNEETDQMTNELRLYYNLDNSKQLHGNECQFVVIPDEMGLFVKKLFNSYPLFIKVSELCDDNEQVNILLKLIISGVKNLMNFFLMTSTGLFCLKMCFYNIPM